MAYRIQDQGPTPREEAVKAELQAAVRRAVDQLPEPFKMVIVLRDIQELPYEEIAVICGERVGTVKSRLHRARGLLRAILLKGGSP